MSNEQMKCPKCNGNMLQGFMIDYAHSALYVGAWYEGQPEKSFWIKTRRPKTQGIPIGAFRCQQCGLLELYSHARFAAQ
jgi:hypothetical protein